MRRHWSQIKHPQAILLVDPTTDQREMYAEVLSSSGRMVYHAKSIDDAARIVSSTALDAVITGTRVPGTATALEFIRTLRAEAETNDIVVVVLAASVSAQTRTAALNAGADGFIDIPCPPEELVVRMDEIADQRLLETWGLRSTSA